MWHFLRMEPIDREPDRLGLKTPVGTLQVSGSTVTIVLAIIVSTIILGFMLEKHDRNHVVLRQELTYLIREQNDLLELNAYILTLPPGKRETLPVGKPRKVREMEAFGVRREDIDRLSPR